VLGQCPTPVFADHCPRSRVHDRQSSPCGQGRETQCDDRVRRNCSDEPTSELEQFPSTKISVPDRSARFPVRGCREFAKILACYKRVVPAEVAIAALECRSFPVFSRRTGNQESEEDERGAGNLGATALPLIGHTKRFVQASSARTLKSTTTINNASASAVEPHSSSLSFQMRSAELS
jgi:hypothetical protein